MMPTSRSADALIPAIPSLDEPIEMLIACHGRVRAFTDTLRKLAAYLPDHGCDDQAKRAAENILRYFRLAAPKHHEDEEQDLFPALRQIGGSALTATLDALEAEHQQLHGLWVRIEPELAAVAEGRGAVLADAEQFAATYQAHAAREEREVFPEAVRLLDAQTLNRIGAAMTARRQN